MKLAEPIFENQQKGNFSLKAQWQSRTDTEIEFHTFINGVIAKVPWKKNMAAV